MKANRRLNRFGRYFPKPKKKLHLTLNYLCALTSSLKGKAKKALFSGAGLCGEGWPTVSVRFDRTVLKFDKPHHYSFIAIVDLKSELQLQSLARKVEKCLKSHGVHIILPRAFSWEFHVTLGWFKGSFAGETALQEVNSVVDWKPITLTLPTRPRFN